MATELIRTSPFDQVVCTLCEGDYHQGVAVLINTLVNGGFTGLFWVGHRGPLPPWVAQLGKREDGLYQVGNASLGFQTIEDSRHFTHVKPRLMTDLIHQGIAGNLLWYFDPDITVRCNWSFFERWIRFGVCLNQEISMGVMASDHPIRCEWMELARRAGWGEPLRQQERYYNAGFIGLALKDRAFLDTWLAANELASAAGVDLTLFQTGSRVNTFHFADQDAMNIAAMYAPTPLTTIGPEGMGWITGGFTMYHSVGSAKPWRKNFLVAALRGIPPSNADKHFLDSAWGPIQPFPLKRLKRQRSMARWASFIGRFYRRG